MKIELLENLTEQEAEELRASGVCLDDWEYMLVCPHEAVEAIPEWTEDNLYAKYEPKSWILDKLLTGCCDNIWYLTMFRGKMVAIGVAYHS